MSKIQLKHNFKLLSRPEIGFFALVFHETKSAVTVQHTFIFTHIIGPNVRQNDCKMWNTVYNTIHTEEYNSKH